MATTTNLNLAQNNLYADGYIIPLADDKLILKRDKLSYIPVVSKDRTHLVLDGDTIWELANRYYGSDAEWKLIADANNILNPMELTTNVRLVIPDPDIIKVTR